MASIFTRIIDGHLPGRLIWADDICVGMLDIRPLHPGHVLVIPRAEVDHWVDLDPDTTAHLMKVAHCIGQAQEATVACRRIGLMIAGFEVPHTHLHVVPISSMAHLNFANADVNAQPLDLDAMADTLRSALRAAGHGTEVDAAR